MDKQTAPISDVRTDYIGEDRGHREQPPRMSALAIVSLAAGIIFPIGGVILGPIAMRHTTRHGLGGRSLAKAGFIVGLCLFITGIVVGLFSFWWFGGFVYLGQTIGIGNGLPLPPTF